MARTTTPPGRGSARRGSSTSRTSATRAPARAGSPTPRGAAARNPKPRTHAGGAGSRAKTDRSGQRRAPSRNTPDRATFRRRRLMVLGLLILLVVGIALGVRGIVGLIGADEEPSAAPAPTQAPSEVVETSAPPTEVELANPVDCRAEALELVVEAPAATTAGGTARFAVSVRNAGAVPCLVDVGSADLVLSISSGDDPIWSSEHCRATERRILLDVGADDASTITWPGTRSAEGCPADPADAEPGTYLAVLTAQGSDEPTSVQAPFVVE